MLVWSSSTFFFALKRVPNYKIRNEMQKIDTRFFASLRALLSLLFLNNSMIRFSYGAVLHRQDRLLEEAIPAHFFDEGSNGFCLCRKNTPST